MNGSSVERLADSSAVQFVLPTKGPIICGTASLSSFHNAVQCRGAFLSVNYAKSIWRPNGPQQTAKNQMSMVAIAWREVGATIGTKPSEWERTHICPTDPWRLPVKIDSWNLLEMKANCCAKIAVALWRAPQIAYRTPLMDSARRSAG
jgi:hypothetical protein